jgi:hypothetical protein
MAGADLFREENTAARLLVAGLFREESSAGWWPISQANRVMRLGRSIDAAGQSINQSQEMRSLAYNT